MGSGQENLSDNRTLQSSSLWDLEDDMSYYSRISHLKGGRTTFLWKSIGFTCHHVFLKIYLRKKVEGGYSWHIPAPFHSSGLCYALHGAVNEGK